MRLLLLALAPIIVMVGACQGASASLLADQAPEGATVLDAPPDVVETTGEGLTKLGTRLSAVILETEHSVEELMEHYDTALKQEDWHRGGRAWCYAPQAQQVGCIEGGTLTWLGPDYDLGPGGVVVAFLSIRRLEGQQWLVRYWELIGGDLRGLSEEEGTDEEDGTPEPPPPLEDWTPQPGGYRDVPPEPGGTPPPKQ